jgi:dipeptidyl aminopeptidase/acylaminoacyl peptidase
MLFRRTFLIVGLVIGLTASAQSKRPLTHADYDGFRSISNQKLSNDGQWLVYGVFPQEGDGEAVLRDLKSGREIRQSAGQRPAPTPPEPGSEAPPAPRNLTVEFTPDAKFVVFTSYPSKADLDQARRERKRPTDQPKNGLVIINLGTGAAVRVASIKSFQVPDTASSHIAYLKESGELVLRALADGSERTMKDVAEYKLTDDAQTLVYADKRGFYAVAASGGDPQTLLAAEGKYTKLTMDQKQTQAAILKDRQLYHWARSGGAATMLAEKVATAGALSFSDDGGRLFFGTAPDKPAAPKEDPTAEKAQYDLWHYQDDFIQPMQKVRARLERDRNFRAVIHLSDKKVVQLADATLPEVQPVREGAYAIGLDDRAYRRQVEHDTRYNDLYLVDTRTGQRRAFGKKLSGMPSVSPDGKYAMLFEGRDWVSYDTATGERRNLTAIAGRNFFNEDDDHPATPPAYAPAIWTKDGRYALVNDKHDVWLLSPDGAVVRNLTDGVGRRENLRFTVVRLNADPRDRGLDPAQPVLLRAEHLETRDSGFYRDSLDADVMPTKLIMAAKNFTAPSKAANADTLVLSASRFDEFPDLHVTNSAMSTLDKVSSVGDQLQKFAWGKGELIKYRNADGVLLQAALYKPAGFDPAKKYPMIVYLYERLSQNIHNFVEPRPTNSINASFYTSNGYVVLMPDIIYREGYPGASAQRCILPATEAVVDMGFVDTNRIGIQGHSWGGYQIAYMVTQTNRFKAAAPGAVVVKMIAAYDGIRWGPGIPRQFQYERTQSRIGGTPWQMPGRYIENSPIFMLDRVQTPMMTIHNDADDAVPWYQGIEFYLALRRLNKEIYLFNYNGEPHNLRRRANQKDYTTRLQQFFDFYLKGAAKPQWMERGRPFIEREPNSPAGPGAASASDIEIPEGAH